MLGVLVDEPGHHDQVARDLLGQALGQAQELLTHVGVDLVPGDVVVDREPLDRVAVGAEVTVAATVVAATVATTVIAATTEPTTVATAVVTAGVRRTVATTVVTTATETTTLVVTTRVGRTPTT
ncbi:hypothetical protein ABZ667_23630, partial [Streptomyces lavendulae]